MKAYIQAKYIIYIKISTWFDEVFHLFLSILQVYFTPSIIDPKPIKYTFEYTFIISI